MSRLMTVSSPCTLGAWSRLSTRAPKSRVTSSCTAVGGEPAPRPQPASAAASASTPKVAARARLADMKDDPRAAAGQRRGVSAGVGGADVEHVASRWKRGGQQVGVAGAGRDLEVATLTAACRHEALAGTVVGVATALVSTPQLQADGGDSAVGEDRARQP